LAAKTVAILVEIAVVAARAAARSAGFAAVNVRLAPVLDTVRAARRSTGAREAHARGAIGRQQAGLAGPTRRAGSATIVVALAVIFLPIQAVFLGQLIIQSAVLGKRAPGPPRSQREEQCNEDARQFPRPRRRQTPIVEGSNGRATGRQCRTL
jgi:hypothetical protein